MSKRPELRAELVLRYLKSRIDSLKFAAPEMQPEIIENMERAIREYLDNSEDRVAGWIGRETWSVFTDQGGSVATREMRGTEPVIVIRGGVS